MDRLPDWEPALVAWLEACERLPFQWGVHDCCSFAAGAVRAQTGADFYEPFAGGYTTELGSQRALKRRGFADLFGPFTAALGDPVAPLLLQRGDIVSDGRNVGVMWNRAGPCGLFVGEPALADDEGLMALPVARLKFGWRVGANG